jgi:hypothetical protein
MNDKCNNTEFLICIFFFGALSIAGLKKKNRKWEVGFYNLRRRWLGSYHGHAGHDHPGPLLAVILGHCATYTHPKVQPAALYCSLATWTMLG